MYSTHSFAGYKVPRGIDFLDSMPLSAAGKLLENRLRDQLVTG